MLSERKNNLVAKLAKTTMTLGAWDWNQGPSPLCTVPFITQVDTYLRLVWTKILVTDEAHENTEKWNWVYSLAAVAASAAGISRSIVVWWCSSGNNAVLPLFSQTDCCNHCFQTVYHTTSNTGSFCYSSHTIFVEVIPWYWILNKPNLFSLTQPKFI
jgi:hypothetical protein